ncbi:hypothetical protein S245_040224, partial [Arachis hypogaea]
WTAYLISILYIEYKTRKEKENVSFKNHVIQLVNFLAPLILFLLLSQFLVDKDKHLSYLIHGYLEE